MNLKSPLTYQKIGYLLYQKRVPVFPKLIDYFIRFVFSCWCPSRTKIGAGCVLGYGGLGVVISERAVIGDRVEIGAGVTLGGNATEYGAPVIEDDVYLGVGAKILGPITIGRGSVVAANSVVTNDVPCGSLVGGVPGTVIRSDIEINKFLFHRNDQSKERNSYD